MKKREDLDLKAWMLELAAGADPGGPLPDPHLIWWKARLRARMEAGAKATRPIRVMEAIACGIGAAALAVLAAVYWPHIRIPQAPMLLLAASLGGTLLLLYGVWREE
ncbi:MAG: hypothetical protein ACLQGV_09785 [Bryobacteraceae bacterium]